MEVKVGDSIEKLLLWSKIYENRTFNKNADKVLENKTKLLNSLDQSCVMYRKRRLLPTGANAQSVCFRLAPLIGYQELATEPQTTKLFCISDANTWTATGQFGRLPIFPERASTRQTWLKILSACALPEIITPLPPLRKQSTNSYATHDSSIPLPVIKSRMSTETFLIRRPTIQNTSPLKIEDDMFAALAELIDLRPLPFLKKFEYCLFYDTHFPLLLTSMSEDGDPCAPLNERLMPPWSPMSLLVNRKRALNQRIEKMELMLNKIERETEDGIFVTELHSPTFDPTSWLWNKLDTSGLRRRYISENALRKM